MFKFFFSIFLLYIYSDIICGHSLFSKIWRRYNGRKYISWDYVKWHFLQTSAVQYISTKTHASPRRFLQSQWVGQNHLVHLFNGKWMYKRHTFVGKFKWKNIFKNNSTKINFNNNFNNSKINHQLLRSY